MASKDLMLRAARLHFEEGKNFEEIAELFHAERLFSSASPKRASALVKEAGKWLLDELENTGTDDDAERMLAERMKKTFGLLDCRVVRGGDTNNETEYAALLRSYGRAAAEYFDDLASNAEEAGDELHVAVSGGQSILDTVSSLMDRRRPNVHWYAAALIGRGCMTKSTHVYPHTTATIGWSRSGRLSEHLFFGTVPPYDLIPEELHGMGKEGRHQYAREQIIRQLDDLMGSVVFQDILDYMNERINMAIAGIGLVNATGENARHGPGHVEKLTMTGLLKHVGIDPALLQAEGAVGDMCYSLFRADGTGDPRWRFFLTAGEGSEHQGVEFYRNLVSKGRPVIVMAGATKEEALIPAMEHGLLNVLVTDAFTAERLLRL